MDIDSTECDLSGPGLARKSMTSQGESLFERCHWLYALCREYLFHDHTPEITQALFPSGPPPAGTQVLELGCGPGVYACEFAKQYPQISTNGIDLSTRLLGRARSRANHLRLENCHFSEGDAQSLPHASNSVDAVIVSRLFLIVPDKAAVLGEIFRVLRPGGRCFIAEPTSGFRTRFPLAAMWLLARLSRSPFRQYREPHQAEVMSRDEFKKLVATQPWASMQVKYDDWYQYAVCSKGPAVAAVSPSETAA